jgi:hypothetical protein
MKLSVFAGSILALAIYSTFSGQAQKAPAGNLGSRFFAASIKPVRWERGQYHGGNCHGIDSHYIAQSGTRPVPLGRCIFPNTVLANIIEFAYKERTAFLSSFRWRQMDRGRRIRDRGDSRESGERH